MSAPNNNGRKVLAWVPLAVLAITTAVAWGANKATVNDHDRRIRHNENAVEQLIRSNERLDERTKQTREDVREIKQDVKDILRALQPDTPRR